jgi:hypothetical protein
MSTTTFSGPVKSPGGFITTSYTLATSLAPLVMTAEDAGKPVLLFTDGCAVTLPTDALPGAKVTVIVNFAQSTGSTISTGGGMVGSIYVGVSTASTGKHWVAAAGNNTITLNGTTTGGIVGDILEFTYVANIIAAQFWVVTGQITGSGTLVTPFSTV